MAFLACQATLQAPLTLSSSLIIIAHLSIRFVGLPYMMMPT